ncbi:MAG: methyltransferase domain-containing protein [Ignavibacterium album]|uniref:methyltransferase domain-containing protein n=1 Tax=Ignavibacterium album TaxID=591197 RepID=UPI0026F315B2|nr:methyltransferase domain-containing protein [Ignavibacterium album]MBI5663015.1 methyltransferase domain-containing protein [Ignavibacterium album]
MDIKQNIFLPGGFKQFRILKSKCLLRDKNTLLIGAQSESIAEKMIDAGASSATVIVNDYESLINSRLNLSKDSKVSVKMMDFENTDFADESFDLVYAQASISLTNRNKIVKEIKRILKKDSVLCVGEITALSKQYPQFVKDIFESSDILPLYHNDCAKYYEEIKFTLLYEEDLTSSLKSYYENTANQLKQTIETLSDQEKSYYKKLLNKISHESNAYLRLGADRYIGFKMLILKLS